MTDNFVRVYFASPSSTSSRKPGATSDLKRDPVSAYWLSQATGMVVHDWLEIDRPKREVFHVSNPPFGATGMAFSANVFFPIETIEATKLLGEFSILPGKPKRNEV